GGESRRPCARSTSRDGDREARPAPLARRDEPRGAARVDPVAAPRENRTGGLSATFSRVARNGCAGVSFARRPVASAASPHGVHPVRNVLRIRDVRSQTNLSEPARGASMEPHPHRYRVHARAGSEGSVFVESDSLPTLRTAAPVQYGGPGDQWSPETL